MKKDKPEQYFFRGTTLGWDGNESNRQMPRTSVTTNPIKAVLFALVCRGNNKVVYISTQENISGLLQDKNVLARIEDEIGFEIKPVEYAGICEGYLLIDDAISILAGLGQTIPTLLDRTLFDMALKDVKKVDSKIVKRFYELSKQFLKKD